MLTPKDLHIRAAALIEHASVLGLDNLDAMACFDLAIRSLNHAQVRTGVFMPQPAPAPKDGGTASSGTTVVV